MDQLMHILCRERPVGTVGNTSINDYLEEQFNMMKFDLQSLPFTCTVWDSAASQMSIKDKSFNITPSPFSEGFTGVGRLVLANTLSDLKQVDCEGAILLLSGSLTQTPLQPKDYPFYFPNEHRELISVLEQKSPAAIVALTGRHPLCGLEPFPLFEDGNFKIPSAYLELSFLSLSKSLPVQMSNCRLCLLKHCKTADSWLQQSTANRKPEKLFFVRTWILNIIRPAHWITLPGLPF